MVKDWEQKDKATLRVWLVGVLRMHSPVTIVFEKKDGTDRTMQCTLKKGIIIPYEPKTEVEGKPPRNKSEETLAVWDIEASGWRSFKLDSIKTINFGAEA